MGITTNLSRRLRQHNGAVVGGAKATRIGRPWKIGLTVEGFGRPTTTSSSSSSSSNSSRRRKSDRPIETATAVAAAVTTGKIACLQFEYMWKHMAPKQSHGKQARLLKLHHLLCKERWTTKSVEARTIPLTVTIYNSSSNSSGDDNDDDDEDRSDYDDDALYQLVTTGSFRQIEFNTLKEKDQEKDTIRSKGKTRTRTTTTTTATALLPEYVQVQVVQDDFADV